VNGKDLSPDTAEAARLLNDAIYREPPVDPLDAAFADLAAAPDIEATQGPLLRLAEAMRGKSPLQYAVARERAIAALKDKGASAPARLVDAVLPVERSSNSAPAAGQGRALQFADPEPCSEPVNGAALLNALAATFRRFVALPACADVALALWTVHTHALDASEASPYLALTSPEKRCGKTRTLSLLNRLVRRPLPASSITPAAVFRGIECYSPTLLIDEADAFLREREELRGVLNSGHTRETAYVLRADGEDHEPRCFSTWSAKALALIGRLPDTLTDRSIVIPMRRRAPQERVERLRLGGDQTGALKALHGRAARWTADHLAALRAAEPDVPVELGDRAADNWRPLLAIADQAGEDWPEQTRRAALALSGAGVDALDSVREQLLADIRDALHERGVERIFTDDLLNDLCSRDDRPWGEWRAGHRMSGVQLAKQLKPFGIRPRLFRDGPKSARGYSAADFADAFSRYLPTHPLHPLQANADGIFSDSATRYTLEPVTSGETSSNADGMGIVTGVTPQNPPPWVKV
jgi:putative DNA primase/helicase